MLDNDKEKPWGQLFMGWSQIVLVEEREHLPGVLYYPPIADTNI